MDIQSIITDNYEQIYAKNLVTYKKRTNFCICTSY
jgi:hypothetical protein